MMATTSQVLHDGVRRSVMQFTGISDGSNETNVVKVDVSELVPVPAMVAITKINYDVNGGILQLLWGNAEGHEPFLVLTDVNEFNYRKIGSLKNQGGDTATGDILFSTLGFELGSSYRVLLELKKF